MDDEARPAANGERATGRAGAAGAAGAAARVPGSGGGAGAVRPADRYGDPVLPMDRHGNPVRPADRYGDVRSPWHRRLARTAAVLASVGGLAWVVWAGLHQADREVRWEDVGFEIVSDSQVLVTFDVIKDAQLAVTCRLEALNRQFAVVGVAQVEVGPSGEHVTRQTEPVTTQERAVTGVVKRCEPA